MHEHIFGDEAPFDQCHASTLVQAGADRFLAAWFGGTEEGKNDVAIWSAEREGGGWSETRQLAKVADLPHWNPALLAAPDGRIYLFFKVGSATDVWQTWTIASDDGGRTWTPPRELVPGDLGGRGPVKNKPIVLSDGAWLAGASLEREEGWDVFADRSEDGGRSWQASALVAREDFPGDGVIQPTVWESAPGRVHMLVRSSCGWILRSDSQDFGRTWPPLYNTDLPNNNSGIDLVPLDDGALASICNPVGEDWGPRSPLSILLSVDNGRTWPRRLDLETDPGEFSYPAIIATPDGLAATYTWNRRRIAFWAGRAEDIPEVPSSGQ